MDDPKYFLIEAETRRVIFRGKSISLALQISKAFDRHKIKTILAVKTNKE